MSKHRTSRGREFNMQAFVSNLGDTIAVGNSSRNARGDLLGPGGKIIATAQEISNTVRNRATKTKSAQVKINPLEQEVSRKEVRGADGIARWEITYADGSVEVTEKLDENSTESVDIDRKPNLGDL
jgi:hypothetical protein